jgi:hypothetical protein
MLALISKLFGSKSNRDIKLIQPLVDKTKEEYALKYKIALLTVPYWEKENINNI